MPASDPAPFRDRRRAESFGSFAELYDAVRPSYPRALIRWLGEEGGGTAADVGCGTGQVARLLVAEGWDVVGVESDERMARVARTHGVAVDVTRFEHWTPSRRFDLITSGQAWHWIDPDVGYRRAAELLAPGGRLALFWNSYGYPAAIRSAIDSTVSRHAPELLAASVPFGTTHPDHAALDAEVASRSSQWFDEPEVRPFAHRRTRTVEDWLAELRTHSAISTLDQDVRTPMLVDLRAALADLDDDGITIDHDARATLLRRR